MEGPSDGPNGNGNGNGSQPPSDRNEYMRQVRENMNKRRQKINENLNQFRPHVKEQMNRLFSNYQAPFYARLRGFSTATSLQITEHSVVKLAASSNRHFEDQETQALAEIVLSGVNLAAAGRWLLTGFAGFMAWRGRKSFRFPFVRPTAVGMGGRYDPLRSLPMKSIWHFARFVSYYVVGWLMIEPVVQFGIMMKQRSTLLSDPRLKHLQMDQYDRLSMRIPGQDQTGLWDQQKTQPDFSSEQSQPADQPYAQASQTYDQQSSQPQQQQQSWGSYSQAAPYQPKQQQPNDTWGSPAIDDFDDASPVSSSAQNNANSGGSAWDRIRQQSQQPQRRQQQQQQRQWGQQQQQQQQSSEWGNIDDANPQRHSASENYSFSAADEERATAKTQAQKEFDALVERERYGVEQDRRGWSRK